MSSVYVMEHGAVVGIEANYVTVTQQGNVLKKIPLNNVDNVSLYGKSQLTTQCAEQFLMRGVTVSFYSEPGKYFGRLQSVMHMNPERQRKQAAFAGSKTALELARKMITAKMHNQLVVLQRYSRSTGVDTVREQRAIRYFEKQAMQTAEISHLMGYEGIAARTYFEAFGRLVDSSFVFMGRNMHPPKDPLNVLLSLGYSLLLNEIYGKIEARGLNPYFGFIHADRERHPAFCSDLMEEWRAPLVDCTVLSLINGHEILSSHFERTDEDATFLNKEGMKIVLRKFERKFSSECLGEDNERISFRRMMEQQISSVLRVIENSDSSLYSPFRIR